MDSTTTTARGSDLYGLSEAADVNDATKVVVVEGLDVDTTLTGYDSCQLSMADNEHLYVHSSM